MSATQHYEPRSPGLAASIARMCLRASLDEAAIGFETGARETLPAGPPTPAGRSSSHGIKRPLRPAARKSYERRHRRSYSGVMPGHLAPRFTNADMSVFQVFADDHRFKGYCDRSNEEIGAIAGVSAKTVQRAKAKARSELISIEVRPVKGKPRHLPSIVRITSPEWLAWLGARKVTGQKCPSTNTSIENVVVDDARAGVAADCGCVDESEEPQAARSLQRDEARASERLAQESLPNEEISEAEQFAQPVPESSGSAAAPRLVDTQPSADAVTFATELVEIAGHRARALPTSWQNANPAQVVQVWLNEIQRVGSASFLRGGAVELLRSIARFTMDKKPDPAPPYSPRYFGPAVLSHCREVERLRTMPVPSAERH